MKINQVVTENLADQFAAMARARGMNVRIAGTPEQERERSRQRMAQRDAERAQADSDAAQADLAQLPELKAKYKQMKDEYDSLGGNNWQYADREQNLTDRERQARDIEHELNSLGNRIARAEKSQGVAKDDVDEGVRVANQQIPGTKNRAKTAYYPTNVKPKVPKLDNPLTDQELARLTQLDKMKKGVAEGNDHSLKKVWDRYAKHLEAGRGNHSDVRQIFKSGDILQNIRKYVKDHHGQRAVDDMERYAEKHKWDAGVTEGMLDNPGEQDSPVAGAIIRRILMQRLDLLSKYGPEKVGQAVDEVADFVGDTDEIGSSDVSGWVRQVEQILGNMGGQGVAEGKGPLGQGNLALALDTLKGSWSGWNQVKSTDPDIEVYDYDDGEGGYETTGTIQHNLDTGEITIDYSGGYGEDPVEGTFHSIGDAMNALRGGYSGSHGGKAPNYDTLASRTLAGPDDLRKTDRAGKKGTLSKSRMDQMKASSAHRMRGGPKGVLPEGSQRVDSLVTDALKIMRGPEVSDAVAALKTVLGDREFNGRRGHYNFYIKQMIDMYGQQGLAEGNYDRDDYYNARQGKEYGRDLTATGYGGDGSKTRRDDIFKGQSKRLPADPFARTSGAVPTAGTGRIHSTAQPDEMDEGDISQLEKDVADAPVAPIANMEGAKEKIGGRHDPADFDDMINRLKKLAGAGPMKTVYDPDRRVYRNMPTAQQPPKQPKK